jgi:hypothetical protein
MEKGRIFSGSSNKADMIGDRQVYTKPQCEKCLVEGSKNFKIRPINYQIWKVK